MKSMLDVNFISEWVSIDETGVILKVDWIENKAINLFYGDNPQQKLDIKTILFTVSSHLRSILIRK